MNTAHVIYSVLICDDADTDAYGYIGSQILYAPEFYGNPVLQNLGHLELERSGNNKADANDSDIEFFEQSESTALTAIG